MPFGRIKELHDLLIRKSRSHIHRISSYRIEISISSINSHRATSIELRIRIIFIKGNYIINAISNFLMDTAGLPAKSKGTPPHPIEKRRRLW